MRRPVKYLNKINHLPQLYIHVDILIINIYIYIYIYLYTQDSSLPGYQWLSQQYNNIIYAQPKFKKNVEHMQILSIQ